MQPAQASDAFKRLKNPELDKLKSANIRATNLGPGVSDMCMDTFRLLRTDPVLTNGQDVQTNLIKEGLTKKVDSLVRQK